MTNLVESTLTEVLVEEAQGLVVETAETTLVIETTASGPDILAETLVTETVTEATTETVYAVEPETILLDVGEQGPQGPAGPAGPSGDAGADAAGKSLVYTGDKLTEVLNYSDAGKTTLVERRVLNYTGNTLTTIQFYNGAGSLTKTRTLTYSFEVMSGYTDATP